MRIVNVLFPVRADYEILALPHTKPVEHIRLAYLRQVIVQNFVHRTARLNDSVRGNTFSEKVLARDITVRQIDVANVVNDAPIDLFRYSVVEAPVPRLHMEYRNLPSLCRNGRQAAVGIPENQHRIRLHFAKYLIRSGDHRRDGFRGAPPSDLEEVVRLTNLQIIKEHLVEF